MSHIVREIRPKGHFLDMSLNNVILSKDRGITLISGRLKEGGKVALQAIGFDDKHWDELQVIDWMKNNLDQIQLTVSLPDEVSGLWLIEYNRACIDGKSSDEAAESAWSVVKSKWYQDRDGQWYRFSEKWDKAVLANDRPTLEILKVGKYPQFVSKENPEGVLAEADLDMLINNFAKHNTVPVTVDHQQAGAVLGWVDRIWRQGQSLFATLRNLSTEFAKQVKAGAYKNRSVEIHKDFDFNGERIGKALTAVSFLGAVTPQVKGMLEPAFSTLARRFQHDGGGFVISMDDAQITRIFPGEVITLGIDITEDSIRIRQKNPGEFREGTFRTITIDAGEGIKAVVGKRGQGDSMEIQTYIFNKSKWTVDEAKKWVKDHGGTISMNEIQSLYMKGDTLLELTEQQLAEHKQKAADEAVAKLKTEHEAALKVQTDEATKLKAQVEETRKKQIAADAEAAYAKLTEKGKILPASKDGFLTLFKSEAEAGRDPAKTVVPLFSELPDKINLTELTKESDKDKPPVDEMQFANATEESKDKLKKIYTYMDSQKWDHNDAVKIKMASAYVERTEKK